MYTNILDTNGRIGTGWESCRTHNPTLAKPPFCPAKQDHLSASQPHSLRTTTLIS